MVHLFLCSQGHSISVWGASVPDAPVRRITFTRQRDDRHSSGCSPVTSEQMGPALRKIRSLSPDKPTLLCFRDGLVSSAGASQCATVGTRDAASSPESLIPTLQVESLCFSGWKGSLNAISLEGMTDGKTQTSDLQEMCYGRAGIMLLRSVHGSHPVMVQCTLKNRWWFSSRKHPCSSSAVGRNLYCLCKGNDWSGARPTALNFRWL